MVELLFRCGSTNNRPTSTFSARWHFTLLQSLAAAPLKSWCMQGSKVFQRRAGHIITVFFCHDLSVDLNRWCNTPVREGQQTPTWVLFCCR